MSETTVTKSTEVVIKLNEYEAKSLRDAIGHIPALSAMYWVLCNEL